MSIELLTNKSLRKNYNKVLKLQTAEEINNFLSTITEQEKNELFCFTYKFAILRKIKRGEPITEYFLIHNEEFIPENLKEIYENADKYLSNIFAIAIFIIAIFICCSYVK